ncbi:helix-turn-helix transcriptional regulator [Actinomyces radicidentis]|uniref:helix-turn-helix transcriptional regulator n=1 Tax=Actinomyces radicidentis TaxID=111015 RepID=UPI00146FF3DD|nr:LuxR C-terminal-related transcriptional regulator [Actinomyces radicidentis]
MAAQSQFQMPDVENAQPLFEEFVTWVFEEIAQLHREAIKSFFLPAQTAMEAKVALMLMLGMADATLAFGRPDLALVALKQAERLSEAFTIYADQSPVPMLGPRARLALVAARSGLVEHARTALAAYEQTVQTAGTREWEPEEIVEATRRYLAAPAPAPVRPTADVDERSHSAAYEIEAEALLILVQRGADPAIEWLRTFLGRARWTGLSKFFWWPLHELLALIQLREGDVDGARTAIVGQAIPAESALLVEAAAAYLKDDHAGCLDLVRRAMAVPDASPRTTLLAAGRTLPEIADELFLGVETVRSTSKALYKRLGVHDRDAAVRVGTASGILEG